MVRRVGDVEQVVRIDLPDMAVRTIYQTPPPLKPDPRKAIYGAKPAEPQRERITRIEWKTEDTLVVSVDTPAQYTFGVYHTDATAPVHMLISADGSKPPLKLNLSAQGKVAILELSAVLSHLPDDPAHLLMLVTDNLAVIGPGPAKYRVSVYRVAIADGSRTLIERGDETVLGYGVDRRGQLVTRTVLTDMWGRTELQGRADPQAPWKPLFALRDKTEKELSKYQLLGLNKDVVYVAARPETAAEGDTTVVRTFDLKSGQVGPVLWSKPGFDADSIILKEWTGEFLAGCYVDDVMKCEFTDPKLNANFKALYRFFDDKRSLSVVSQADDDSAWILLVEGPDDPGSYQLFDLKTHELLPLFARSPDLAETRLGHMRRINFKASDGVDLFAYVTTPPNLPAGAKAPLVVLPHGGPEARDSYAFDVMVQFLATRGYVVLQPNFRGSGGFGRKFAEAGHVEWGGRMHQDVMDSVKALLTEGGADPDRVCIVGASYGGYEALQAAASSPETFRCAVDISGVSDLGGFLKWQKSFGRDSDRFRYWIKSIGDPVADAAKLAAASPYRAVDRWKTPLLIIHGADDAIVPVEESRQMKRAMDRSGKAAEYVEIKGMGHSPATPEAIKTELGAVAAFLAKHLGPAGAPAGVATATN